MDEDFSPSESFEIANSYDIISKVFLRCYKELDRQLEAFPIELEDRTQELFVEPEYLDAINVLEKYKDRDENIKNSLEDIYRSQNIDD